MCFNVINFNTIIHLHVTIIHLDVIHKYSSMYVYVMFFCCFSLLRSQELPKMAVPAELNQAKLETETWAEDLNRAMWCDEATN